MILPPEDWTSEGVIAKEMEGSLPVSGLMPISERPPWDGTGAGEARCVLFVACGAGDFLRSMYLVVSRTTAGGRKTSHATPATATAEKRMAANPVRVGKLEGLAAKMGEAEWSQLHKSTGRKGQLIIEQYGWFRHMPRGKSANNFAAVRYCDADGGEMAMFRGIHENPILKP